MGTERIKIYPLKIMLNTNEDKQVELKPNMFIFDSSISGDGPYVCTNVLYSQSRLILMTHKQRVELFMNKNKLNDFCNVSKAVKETSIETNKIIEINIGVMLKAMFPISFPIASNVISLCENTNISEDNLFQQIQKQFGNESTYLNIDKPKTVTSVVWLNVMHFHPEYVKLYKIVSEYYENVENKYGKELEATGMDELITKIGVITSKKIEILDKPHEWKLYYMFRGMKKPSSEYNKFMEEYVKKFISANASRAPGDQSRVYQSEESRQAANEKQFMESVEKELAFHFKYIKEIVNYMPLERSSMNTNVQQLFENNMLNSQDFLTQMNPPLKTNTEYCTTVDKMKDGEYYEIHLGISLVGGKITDTSIFKKCKFDSHRLGKMITDYNLPPKYPAYPYIDMDEPKEPVKKGGTKRRRNKRRRRNTRRQTI